MKGKSPIKSPEKGDDSDNEKYEDDEGHHIHFAPVVPLPAKVEVNTGEEEEQELYVQRAKLFRFVSGEWKERGVGNLKILNNKTTGKLRVVMRRDQVHKICLNHVLTNEITYTNKDDKTWLFTANDFSEGELAGWQQFCLRFKTKEFADEFKQAADDARSGKLQAGDKDVASVKSSSSDEVVFVSEMQATNEEKQKAKDLMLPENFYLYTRKPTCKGCRGCEQHEDKTLSAFPTPADQIVKTPLNLADKTPAKVQFSPSPSGSVFATPMAGNRSSSIFQTPVGGSDDSRDERNTSMDKENSTPNSRNTTVVKPPLLATPKLAADAPHATKSDPKTIFGAAANGGTNMFNTNQSMFKFGSKDTNLTEQKKTTLFSGEPSTPAFGNAAFGATISQKSDAKSIFSAATTQAGEAKSTIFGSAQTTSIFGNTQTTPIFGKSQTTSIFGTAANQKAGTLFGSNEQKDAKSIFGTATESAEPKSIFGSTGQSTWGSFSDQKSIFGGQKPVFGLGDKKSEDKTNQNSEVSSIFGSVENKLFGSGAQNAGGLFASAASNGTPTFGSVANAPEVSKTPNLFNTLANVNNQTQKCEEAPVPFATDSLLTFAAIESNGPGFTKNDNFRWEGAGQQLFGSAAKRNGGEVKSNESKENSKLNKTEEEETQEGGEEDYDPHYEPIVPLPDKIVVTTGEEDEEKLFGERSKLFRYDEEGHEWKERGVGEMKLLYHPQRETYRLLLRRDQVYKLVLNTLLHKDLELLPMKNSVTAWTFAAKNYAESTTGEMETLACKFKNKALAAAFKEKVEEFVRKLQVADAQAYRAKQEGTSATTSPPAPAVPASPAAAQRAVLAAPAASTAPAANQQDTDTTDHAEEVHYEYDEDYDEYYNEDEDGAQVLFEAPGAAHVSGGEENADADEAVVQLLYDSDMCAHKLLVVDATTGEILADTLVAPEMPAQVEGDTVRWTGAGYDEQELTVCFELSDAYEAMRLHDAVATVKAEMEKEDE